MITSKIKEQLKKLYKKSVLQGEFPVPLEGHRREIVDEKTFNELKDVRFFILHNPLNEVFKKFSYVQIGKALLMIACQCLYLEFGQDIDKSKKFLDDVLASWWDIARVEIALAQAIIETSIDREDSN